MFMDVQNGDINVIVVKDDKFEDIIADEKKVICDRAEEARVEKALWKKKNHSSPISPM